MQILVVGFQQLGEGQATQLESLARKGLVCGHTQEELVASKVKPVGQTMHILLKESQLASAAQLMHVLLKARLGIDFGHTHLLRSVLYQRLLGQDTHFCVLQFQKLGTLQETQWPSPLRWGCSGGHWHALVVALNLAGAIQLMHVLVILFQAEGAEQATQRPAIFMKGVCEGQTQERVSSSKMQLSGQQMKEALEVQWSRVVSEAIAYVESSPIRSRRRVVQSMIQVEQWTNKLY